MSLTALSPCTPPASPQGSDSRKHPGTPITDLDAHIHKVAKKALFESPPKRMSVPCPVPKTPGKKPKAPLLVSDPFKNALPTMGDSWFNPDQHPDHVNLGKIYRTLDNQRHYVFQQPPQKGSCGAGALLMLYADLLHSIQRKDIPRAFWEWYNGVQFANLKNLKASIEMRTPLNELGFFAQTKIYHQDDEVLTVIKSLESTPENAEMMHITSQNDLLDDMRGILEKSESSLIVSVTHKILKGHWIVIDEIINELIYIRDPFSGKAYSISKDELFECWPEEDSISCLFLKKLP